MGLPQPRLKIGTLKTTLGLKLGMEGYGSIGLLINFDDERIVYGHSVHRDFDFKRLYTKVIDDGRY